LEAFLSLGYLEEAEAFLEWLLHATRLTQPRLQVLYDVYGETELPEKELTHLEGWRRSRPVRIGNSAHDQLQLDAYGQVVAAAATFVKGGGELDIVQGRMLRGLGRAVTQLWRSPDSGIWEVRGERRHYTHSKVMCWAALDCLLDLHDQGAVKVPRKQLEDERAAVAQMIEERCLDPERGYRAGIESGAADASLLLLPRYRYLDGKDPRMVRTFETIDRELMVADALLLRYPPGFDGMQGEEHAFGICSFWAVEALARLGRIEEAERRMKIMLGHASDLGFYAEEISAVTGEAIGNFPQAFTHVGLILAAAQIAVAKDDREKRR
jgi:GH15 family glucan-1,4-alpha-glucosidase